MGFVLQPDEAQGLLDKHPRNSDVLFPYINGEDLNSRWDQSPSRWVINFHNWPIEKAMEYTDCFEIVERLVKPEREKNNRKVRRERWWQFAERAADLYATIAELDRVLVGCQTAKYVSLAFAPSTYVYSHATNVFASDADWMFALLASSIHDAWAREYSGSLETRLRYSPTDCFETFALPSSPESLDLIASQYHSHRGDIMASRHEGLTSTYNRFHSKEEVSQDIVRMRELHLGMDYAIARAYGWADLDLAHGFYETKQGTRYTLSEIARREVLDRLLALNHECHAQEQAPVEGETRRKPKKAKRAAAHPELF
jgi:hypothetical protein